MHIRTSRFGTIDVDERCVLELPRGLFGFEDRRHWILLEETKNDAVVWLQSLEQPELALALVSPRRFVPGYQARVSRRELARVGLDDPSRLEVLVIASGGGATLSLNLKAPLIVDHRRGIAGQVVASGDLPVCHLLGVGAARRRSA